VYRYEIVSSLSLIFCRLRYCSAFLRIKALVFTRGRHAMLRDAASDSMRESGESILL